MSDFLIEKVSCKEAIDWSPHHHAYINPYNGCTAGCPFCFWLSQKGWENRIQIRENIVGVLDDALKAWDSKELIYLGSVCDPFMEIEREHRLSRGCLEVIKKHERPLLITTSATNDVVREYVDLLKSMPQRVVVVVELSRLALLREYNSGGVHAGIENANYLRSHGLEVWATVSPVLPGVTDLDVILEALDAEIPVYVDSLQCESGGIQARKVMDWIRNEHPHLEEEYARIVIDQDTSYFDAIMDKYSAEQRIHRFPFDF